MPCHALGPSQNKPRLPGKLLSWRRARLLARRVPGGERRAQQAEQAREHGRIAAGQPRGQEGGRQARARGRRHGRAARRERAAQRGHELRLVLRQQQAAALGERVGRGAKAPQHAAQQAQAQRAQRLDLRAPRAARALIGLVLGVRQARHALVRAELSIQMRAFAHCTKNAPTARARPSSLWTSLSESNASPVLQPTLYNWRVNFPTVKGALKAPTSTASCCAPCEQSLLCMSGTAAAARLPRGHAEAGIYQRGQLRHQPVAARLARRGRRVPVPPVRAHCAQQLQRAARCEQARAQAWRGVRRAPGRRRRGLRRSLWGGCGRRATCAAQAALLVGVSLLRGPGGRAYTLGVVQVHEHRLCMQR